MSKDGKAVLVRTLSGRSPAKGFRMAGEEVRIRKQGASVVLEPVSH